MGCPVEKQLERWIDTGEQEVGSLNLSREKERREVLEKDSRERKRGLGF